MNRYFRLWSRYSVNATESCGTYQFSTYSWSVNINDTLLWHIIYEILWKRNVLFGVSMTCLHCQYGYYLKIGCIFRQTHADFGTDKIFNYVYNFIMVNIMFPTLNKRSKNKTNKNINFGTCYNRYLTRICEGFAMRISSLISFVLLIWYTIIARISFNTYLVIPMSSYLKFLLPVLI